MDTLWGGITKLVGTTLQWLTPFGWFHSARDWMASKGYKNDPSAMIHSTLTFSAVLLLIGGFVLNLVWNINTLGSIDTRMNAACVQQFGGNAVSGWGGAEIRRELFEYTFGARFSSWIITGIQCALILGTIFSMFVTENRKSNMSIFALAHFMNVVMLILYGVLLYHAFNNGVAWAWDQSGGICAGTYKSSNSQAGVMLLSAIFSAVYTVIITSAFPMHTREYVNMHAIYKDAVDKLGPHFVQKLGRGDLRGASSNFFYFMRTHIVWIFGIAAFLGSYAISGYMLFSGSPTVESQVESCGIMTHIPTPPAWLIAVGDQTDFSGQNMAMGIFIMGSLAIMFTATALSTRLRMLNFSSLDPIADTLSGRAVYNFELGGPVYLSRLFNNWRTQNALRMSFVAVMLLLWGRLLALSNSVWMPSVFTALLPGCTRSSNFTGVHVWIGFTCLAAYMIFNEMAEWGSLFAYSNDITSLARFSRSLNATSSLEETHRIKNEIHQLTGNVGNTEHMVACARMRARGL
jgi:hypothetical protein